MARKLLIRYLGLNQQSLPWSLRFCANISNVTKLFYITFIYEKILHFQRSTILRWHMPHLGRTKQDDCSWSTHMDRWPPDYHVLCTCHFPSSTNRVSDPIWCLGTVNIQNSPALSRRDETCTRLNKFRLLHDIPRRGFFQSKGNEK